MSPSNGHDQRFGDTDPTAAGADIARLTHGQRLDVARSAIRYISSRSEEDLLTPVPNCPGWTVYNAIVHIGKVGVAWHAMIDAPPSEPESRTRGYADAQSRGSNLAPDVLASWATAAVDALDDDLDRACYFSMTGGYGTVALWAWHAASELGIHRLDVESALGQSFTMDDRMAADAIAYTAEYFLPAMTRAVDETLGSIRYIPQRDGTEIATVNLGATGEPEVIVSGKPVDVLLAMWGRPHGDLDLDGSADVFKTWHALPSKAFQFGTWD